MAAHHSDAYRVLWNELARENADQLLASTDHTLRWIGEHVEQMIGIEPRLPLMGSYGKNTTCCVCGQRIAAGTEHVQICDYPRRGLDTPWAIGRICGKECLGHVLEAGGDRQLCRRKAQMRATEARRRSKKEPVQKTEFYCVTCGVKVQREPDQDPKSFAAQKRCLQCIAAKRKVVRARFCYTCGTPFEAEVRQGTPIIKCPDHRT